MSPEGLRAVVARLNLSAGTLMALGFALDARAGGKPIGPALQPRLDAVVDALGARQFLEGLSPAELQPVLAELRLTMLQGGKLPSAAIGRVYRALRPGGWVLFATADPGSEPPAGTYARLRTAFWGGVVLAPAEAERLPGQAGFVHLQTPPSPPFGPVIMVVARRRS